MSTVKECLSQKTNILFSVKPTSPVQQILEVMRDNKVRSMLVIEDEKLCGIVSQGDCAIKVLLNGKDAKQVLAQEIMTKNLITVSPNESIDHCMAIMVSKHIRHLPVLDAEKVVGVISIGDIVKKIMEQQGTQINFLETYIKGHGVM